MRETFGDVTVYPYCVTLQRMPVQEIGANSGVDHIYCRTSGLVQSIYQGFQKTLRSQQVPINLHAVNFLTVEVGEHLAAL